MESRDNSKAAFLLLELAEQGRPVEVFAQFLSSYLLCGDGDATELLSFTTQVFGRTIELMDVSGQIWEGLMPGPPISGPRWEVREAGEVKALDRIALLLSGNEWNASHIEAVAEIIRSTGRPINDPRLTIPMMTCLTVKNWDGGWLLYDLESGNQYYRWCDIVFTNISHPADDELTTGMTIEVPERDLHPLAIEEVADALNPYRS